MLPPVRPSASADSTIESIFVVCVPFAGFHSSAPSTTRPLINGNLLATIGRLRGSLRDQCETYVLSFNIRLRYSYMRLLLLIGADGRRERVV